MAQKHKKKGIPHASNEKNALFIQLLAIVILASATVLPFIFDSFTVSKLLVASAGLLALSINLLRFKTTSVLNPLPRWLASLVTFFGLAMIFSWSKSGVPLTRGAFGQFGRGNGLIYYLLAILIFILAIKTFNRTLKEKAHQLITYFSLFLAIYASLQRIGIDIATLDTRGISAVVLTFGNSNFAGGMLSVLFTYHFIHAVISRKFNIRTISLLLILLLGSTFAAAVQGYLIIVFALILGFSLHLFNQNKSVWIPRILAATWLLGFIAIILGLLNKFILAGIFARSTFKARIEYWHIAINIIKDHLLFGVGPDKLYDVSATYMSPGALKITTYTRMDNSHNWYLNVAANYGIFVFILLMLILGSVFLIGFKLIRQKNSSDNFAVASFAAFIAMFIDGLVSLEQPGIGIWLYWFGGVTIGCYLNSNNLTCSSNQKEINNSKLNEKSLQRTFSLVCIVLLSSSTLLTSVRVVQDALLRNEVQIQLSGKGTEATLGNIGSLAVNLKAEPEYTVQALKSLAAASDAMRLDNVSKATYDYYPNSIQATLIRADVLRALGRIDESCPLRNTLLNNTPWDKVQLDAYIICLVSGFKYQESLEILGIASKYMPADQTADIPVADGDLNVRFVDYAISARVNFILGNFSKAKQEKLYAERLLVRILEIERTNGISALQPEREPYLKLLNF